MGATSSYTRLLKLKQTSLLVFSGLVPMIVAGSGAVGLREAILYILGVGAAVAGTTAVNMYFDRDIDAAMRRTSNRPLPKGEIDPPHKAVILGMALFALGILVSLQLNTLVAGVVALGFGFDIFVYTLATKRRTPWSVVFGGVAGAAPALAGWAAATGTLGLGGLLFAALVMLWIPEHIWTLATHYADDYARAGVPMLPVVWGPRRSALATFACAVGTSVLALYLGFVAGLGWAYELVVAIASAILLWATGSFARSPSAESALRAFKVANSYLGIVLLAALAASVL